MLTLRIPADDPRYAVIGRIAILHSQLETVLKMTVKVLAGITKEDAMAMTADAESSQVQRMIKGLVRLRTSDTQIIKYVDSLMTEAMQCATERNIYLHSMWGLDEGGTPVQYVRDRDDKNRHRFLVVPVPSLDQCQQLATRIEAHVLKLNEERLRGTIAALAGATNQGADVVQTSVASYGVSGPTTADQGRSLSSTDAISYKVITPIEPRK